VLIDPFTIIAQIVNFAILAVALKYVLYDRVIEAMDQREASIASRLEEAERREIEAESAAEAFRQRSEQLERDRHELLHEARAGATKHRQDLLDQARADVDDERRRWQRSLQAEQQEFHRELQRRTALETVELSRRALADLAHADLETAVIDLGLDHLATDHRTRADLFGGDGSATPLTVRTAFPLSEERRSTLTQQLRGMGLDPDRAVRFDQALDLVLGIELQGDGTAVSWHVDDYLDQLGDSFDQFLEATERGDDDG